MASSLNPVVPCLWFTDQAEQAAAFYTSLFPNSWIGHTSRYGPGAALPAGTALVCTFYLDGQEWMALNGGPAYQLTPAFSVVRRCDTQAEIDHCWDHLIADGGQPGPCGWLTDRFGVSWQIVPRALGQMLADPDPAKVAQVTRAYMQMQKFDLAALERIFE